MNNTIQVTINGNNRTIQNVETVTNLLESLQLQPIRVAVEINEQLIPRRQFDQTKLQTGDRIEIVTFVGGG